MHVSLLGKLAVALTACSLSLPLWSQAAGNVSVHLELAHDRPGSKHKERTVPAVLWLQPLTTAGAAPVGVDEQTTGYTLEQKNKTFIPHLLVVPVGSFVSFPNEDPFFHNVFSLYDGKRFDLGLYEAGKTRQVRFAREGVSYIFCNIHPQMSAVVVALSTPFYSIADAAETFHLHHLPYGEYEMHLWVEGEEQRDLDRWTRPVHIGPNVTRLETIELDKPASDSGHLNKFGKPYQQDNRSPY